MREDADAVARIEAKIDRMVKIHTVEHSATKAELAAALVRIANLESIVKQMTEESLDKVMAGLTNKPASVDIHDEEPESPELPIEISHIEPTSVEIHDPTPPVVEVKSPTEIRRADTVIEPHPKE